MVSIATPLILDKLFLAFFILYVTSWNNFIIPMITLTRKDRFTLPVMISSLADPLRYDVGATFLALLFSIIPVVVLFIIIRNRVFGEVV
ncbi:MAG: hypothetical protein EA374_03360 [Acholeplasmatales bacterium]|nr:MAG: hypothetical protein EA374_03360 [Acholeplasmatales bacterium]